MVYFGFVSEYVLATLKFRIAMLYRFVLASCLSLPLHAIVCPFDHNYMV